MATLSVIVTTYQRHRALDKVLASLAAQSSPPEEVVVADDGSGPETARCVAAWQTRLSFPLHHVRQEHLGFRAAAARNRAVARSSGDYLVFLDGDCLAFPDFLAQHRTLAEPGWLVVGNRLLLSPRLSARVETDGDPVLAWPAWRWGVARLRGHLNRLLPLLRLPDGRWRKRRPNRWQGARTCNLALWRCDFMAVNGFDERYQGWGHEDADLVARLIRHGCARKDGHFAVPVLHLWHPPSDRREESGNAARLAATLRGSGGEERAAQGVDQYLREGDTAMFSGG